jgi:hypothetical protein
LLKEHLGADPRKCLFVCLFRIVPEVSGSERSSDHGEELDDMYTPDSESARKDLISEETIHLSRESPMAGNLAQFPGQD